MRSHRKFQAEHLKEDGLRESSRKGSSPQGEAMQSGREEATRYERVFMGVSYYERV